MWAGRYASVGRGSGCIFTRSDTEMAAEVQRQACELLASRAAKGDDILLMTEDVLEIGPVEGTKGGARAAEPRSNSRLRAANRHSRRYQLAPTGRGCRSRNSLTSNRAGCGSSSVHAR
jgi:hypothetical protein